MAEHRIEGQAVWFSSNSEGNVTVFHYTGEGISKDLGEFELDQFVELPTEPGLYVWEGDWVGYGPGWAGAEPVDAHSEWQGETRCAEVEDLEAMARDMSRQCATIDEAHTRLCVLLLRAGRAIHDYGEHAHGMLLDEIGAELGIEDWSAVRIGGAQTFAKPEEHGS